MVSLEPEDGTIEAFWEADGRVTNQHPLRCLLPIDIPPVSDMCKINVINKWKHRDIPPGNKNTIIFQRKKQKA